MDDQAVWPPSQQIVETDWSLADLQPGDLVFSSKADGADWIQWIFEVSNHQWRHVGAVFDRNGELCIVEINGNAFHSRSIDEFIESYDRFGAARLDLSPRCIARATDWMVDKVGDDHVYAWDDLLLAGILALTKPGVHRKNGPRVRAALDAALKAAKEGQTYGATDSYTCSGFIQMAYDLVGDECSIVHERWRSGESWPPRLESLDDLLREDLDPAEQRRLDDLYGDASLIELYELGDVVDRGPGMMEDGQLGETIRVLLHAIAGFAKPAPDRLDSDGRWVTPADLWDSRSVSARGPLLTE